MKEELTEVKVTCKYCGRSFFLMCPSDGLRTWLSGDKKIQDALPTLKPSARELMISHVCADCFEDLTKEQTDIVENIQDEIYDE